MITIAWHDPLYDFADTYNNALRARLGFAPLPKKTAFELSPSIPRLLGVGEAGGCSQVLASAGQQHGTAPSQRDGPDEPRVLISPGSRGVAPRRPARCREGVSTQASTRPWRPISPMASAGRLRRSARSEHPRYGPPLQRAVETLPGRTRLYARRGQPGALHASRRTALVPRVLCSELELAYGRTLEEVAHVRHRPRRRCAKH
jgi:hypothetical protein